LRVRVVSRYGIHRFGGRFTNDSLPGWRLMVPLWVATRTAYDIMSDCVYTGRWVWSVALGVNRLGAPKWTHGASARLTWGWTPAVGR
jgi:hypothetical protein